ncbi:coenzyme PQQ synthesis protein D (PqqD) [Neobacillus bataviensis]|uniref:Coenzyme PQQ synthesis protein D (PqqD) n=1 Tax=Neobacillus bataviensis TaxID=220685 RepID=A0A561D6L9_9BACI|nr:PqqD family protein [Neobacillus bataviensis]TWD98887.1 coenzyme PQQ synthesis protein D (PqqD) [Neobacillus bataviensis]
MMTQYIQKGIYETTELDGEFIILNTDDYTITKLNDVGGYCWSKLNEVQTVATLTKNLIEKFSINGDETQVERDMEEFLENLLQCGLIQYAD